MKPFPVFEKVDIAIERALGCFVYDDQQQSYLDLYGGHAVISVGHSHPHVIAQVLQQINKIGFYSNAVKNDLQDRFAQRLGLACGYPTYAVFFSNSGAEANENALKLASFHTGRRKVLAMSNAFHGRTSAAVSATDIRSIRAPLNESEQFVFTPFNDISSLKKQLETEEYCAVIIEPIQGVGGIHQASPDFLQAVRSICTATGTLLILDEIQCGYGRTGLFFAHQHAGIEADLITVAKGIANGLPMGATIISPKIKPVMGQLGTTFGGSQVVCAAALAVLDVIHNEQLIDNAAAVGEFLLTELRTIDGVSEVRGRGLMIGVEFENDIKRLREELLFSEKVFTGYAGRYTLRLLPPLCFTRNDAETFLKSLRKLVHKDRSSY
ncbi:MULTISPECIES: aspartate aminotransferase family protein [unclassified Sphingobacterium]|uniref:aspartate aminotransferase family protein n=1 Tax=unclassified Sphingobacterium TaxID=2609468 RepID=UPI0025CF3853|nr:MULTISPECIES: aminotransferase class III-fold pyridoxal phosphate-dependent enzyme [unclassified Sphingobacterium]